jgi:hypothetical protein
MASACHSAYKESRMGTTLEREMVRSSEIENRGHVYVTFDHMGRIPESSYKFASEDEKIDRMVSCPPNCLTNES